MTAVFTYEIRATHPSEVEKPLVGHVARREVFDEEAACIELSNLCIQASLFNKGGYDHRIAGYGRHWLTYLDEGTVEWELTKVER